VQVYIFHECPGTGLIYSNKYCNAVPASLRQHVPALISVDRRPDTPEQLLPAPTALRCLVVTACFRLTLAAGGLDETSGTTVTLIYCNRWPN